jgi:hypothetical protein
MRLLVAALALAALSVHADDLRGVYRAALCGRPDMSADECSRTVRGTDGVAQSSAPPRADASRYRLLFVPGFMASCFPGIHSFADIVLEARKEGYAADVLAVGGRNGVPANAKLIAEQLARGPDDGRRIVLIGHSKGADDALEAIATRPDLAPRIVAVLSVAGALNGSPHADDLRGAYTLVLADWPFSSCAPGEGDPVRDLTPEARRAWWARNADTLRTPVYSLAALPDLDRLSPALVVPYLALARLSRDNDGMLLSHNEVAPGGHLLGFVNADHLAVAIPYPGNQYVLVFNATPFPRPQVFLSAIDVIAQREETRP